MSGQRNKKHKASAASAADASNTTSAKPSRIRRMFRSMERATVQYVARPVARAGKATGRRLRSIGRGARKAGLATARGVDIGARGVGRAAVRVGLFTVRSLHSLLDLVLNLAGTVLLLVVLGMCSIVLAFMFFMGSIWSFVVSMVRAVGAVFRPSFWHGAGSTPVDADDVISTSDVETFVEPTEDDGEAAPVVTPSYTDNWLDEHDQWLQSHQDLLLVVVGSAKSVAERSDALGRVYFLEALSQDRSILNDGDALKKAKSIAHRKALPQSRGRDAQLSLRAVHKGFESEFQQLMRNASEPSPEGKKETKKSATDNGHLRLV